MSVFGVELLAGERVARHVFVASVYDPTAKSAEASISTNSEERSVEERVVLTQILFLLCSKGRKARPVTI